MDDEEENEQKITEPLPSFFSTLQSGPFAQ